jgi:hypothetical protein
MNFKLVIGIAAYMLVPASADESDLLDRTERVAYCIAPKVFERDRVKTIAPLYAEKAKELDRMQAFVNSVIVDRISTPSAWPAAIATAARSGSRDSGECQHGIEAEFADQGSPQVNECIADHPNDMPGLALCVQAAGPPECKRVEERCRDMDGLLPF